MPFSLAFRNAVCNAIRSNADLTQIDPYCALFNGEPGSGGTEVTSTIDSAGRALISFGAPSDGVMANDADIDFGMAENAATVTHFAIYDAASAGNRIAHGALIGGSEAVVAGNAVRFNAGDLTVNVT